MGLKKYTFPPHSKWFMRYLTLYLPFIRGETIIINPSINILCNEKISLIKNLSKP